jgi:hypothetical protein
MKPPISPVAQFRVENDLTQADLSRLLTECGVPTSLRTIQGWEQGRATPPWVLPFLARISKRQLREFERAPRRTRPAGVSTKHRR